MSKQKNILILTETRGGKGHIMPAKAITQALHRLFPHKHNVSLVNMGDESNFALEDTLHFLYVQISKHAPWVLRLYKVSDHKIFMKTVNNIYYVVNQKDILKLYNRVKPDLVLSNYPAWDYAFFKTLKKYYPSVPYVNLNTDSNYPHYGWLLADADYNIVADEDTKRLYLARGKDGAKIKVLGIPIREDVARLAQSIKLSALKPKPPYKILIMPTSNNAKNIMLLTKQFAGDTNFELEIIMGRNKTAIEYIKSKVKGCNVLTCDKYLWINMSSSKWETLSAKLKESAKDYADRIYGHVKKDVAALTAYAALTSGNLGCHDVHTMLKSTVSAASVGSALSSVF